MNRPSRFATSPRDRLRNALLGVSIAVSTLAPSHLGAQQDPAVLLRDQQEILRKAERMRTMMQGLLDRYVREEASDKVKLLRDGLKHLEETKLVEEIATAKQNLDAGATAEALRRQQAVIDQIEKLIAILLERPTVESLEAAAADAEALRATASELAKRQAELKAEVERSDDAARSPAEAALDNALAELARELRREAQENRRAAGPTRPMIEAALDQVGKLLDQQAALERNAPAELSGQRSAAEETAFRIGALQRALDELAAAQARMRDLERVSEATAQIGAAIEAGDRERAEQMRDQARSIAERVARTMEEADVADKSAIEAAAGELGATPGPARPDAKEAAAMQAAAKALAEAANAARERIAAAAARLREAAAAEIEGAVPEAEASSPGAAQALKDAAKALDDVRSANEKAAAEDARDAAAKATRKAADARAAIEAANPATEDRARTMAETAAATRDAIERALKPEEKSPESAASTALKQAEAALRETSTAAEEAKARGDRQAAERAASGMQQSRESLEAAKTALEQALARENAGSESARDSAAKRNEQLQKQLEQAGAAMAKAGTSGEMSPEQAQAGERAMQEAKSAMQQASDALQSGQQAKAANQQDRAADAAEAARQAMAENRPPSAEERQRLAEAAQRQKQLEDEIARLAELLEERDNKRAAEAAKAAADAAERAERALERGDARQAAEEQAEAQRKLEQAARELEEERDRYQDLRQEELLFKIGEELQQFLEQQRPITAATTEAAAALEGGQRLTRPMRRNLNQLGERERELVGKLRFLHEALTAEGTRVFAHVLELSERDLLEVADRLASREPDVGEYTRLLQADVEARVASLIQALEKERQRRREEAQRRQQQGEQQPQEQQANQFGPQRERLVPILSEALMLKQMEEGILQRTKELDRLFTAAGGDGLTPADTAMAERLAWQHAAISELFHQLEAQLQAALGGAGEDGDRGNEGK
ncbi:MAG: hypothetical protein AB7I19_00105 [Planctomycetota bacterium]